MPSYFESLSMVALEAWAMGKPVLANGRCDVLKGQCIRSGAGLYDETYEEFVETLYALESKGPIHTRLGRNGREYFRLNYDWPVIERNNLDMLEQLRQRSGPPRDRTDARDGWPAAARISPPARTVLAGVPAGAVVPQHA